MAASEAKLSLILRERLEAGQLNGMIRGRMAASGARTPIHTSPHNGQ
jgi:hypothetical protein